MARIRGATRAERAAARAARSLTRAAEFAIGRVQNAPNPRAQLSRVCDHLRAVAARLDPDQVREVTREVAEVADRWARKAMNAAEERARR